MKHTDFLIVGTGAAGLFCALQIPSDKQVLMITTIMTVILKIRCVPGTMKIEKNPSIL